MCARRPSPRPWCPPHGRRRFGPPGRLQSPGEVAWAAGRRAAAGRAAWAASRSLQLPGRGARRIQVLADPVQGLTRVTGGEDAQVTVDAEPGADLDAVADDARVEAVQRPHRRTPSALTAEVIDAAVTGADEAPGGGHEAHGTAGVHAARGDVDDPVDPARRPGVDGRVALAHIDGRLAH